MAARLAVEAVATEDLCGAAVVAEGAMRQQQTFVTDGRAEADAVARQLELLMGEVEGDASVKLGSFAERLARLGGRLSQAEDLNREAREALYTQQPACVFLL